MYFYELDLHGLKIDLSCTLKLVSAAKREVQSRTMNLLSTYRGPGTIARGPSDVLLVNSPNAPYNVLPNLHVTPLKSLVFPFIFR